MRICICASQVPFVTGGAELLVDSLRRELLARGFEVDVVSVPFAWEPHARAAQSAFAWRLLHLMEEPGRPIDLVIATKFPSYFVQHPAKVLWLVHQFRQVYELLDTPFSDYGDSAEDRDLVSLVREMDTRALVECRRRFAIARTPVDRLQRYNGLLAAVLYPPPPLEGRYHEGAFGDYVFTATRLDAMKRVDLLLRALAHTRTPMRAKIAGRGPERAALEVLVAELGLSDRVELLGWVDDEQLVDLYAGSLAVYYAPFDEDYGYVTVEGFRSGKPVLTTCDAGGVLEFVEDGVNGYVSESDAPRRMAAHFDRLYEDRNLARQLGEAGNRRVASISWDHVIWSLTGVRAPGEGA